MMLPCISAIAAPKPILVDLIDYKSWDEGPSRMSTTWQSITGVPPKLVKPSPGVTMFSLNNAVIGTGLTTPITDGFELSFDALHERYARLLWAGLFNADGTQGYVLLWDSSLESSFKGEGFVCIHKVELPGPPNKTLRFNTKGKPLGSNLGSLHTANQPPLAHLKLTWDRASHTLRAYVNDKLIQTVKDDSFNDFTRLYIGGTTGSLFDNVTVTAPR
jgi:hypothetical protein